MSETEVQTAEFVVEIRHFEPGKRPELIRLETDEKEYAEFTAQLGIFKNSWQLVSKNF